MFNKVLAFECERANALQQPGGSIIVCRSLIQEDDAMPAGSGSRN
jgi:hypothetical protein